LKKIISLCALCFSLAPAILFANPSSAVTGKVVESIDAAGYTYILIDDGAARIWVAAPQVKVTAGEQVTTTGSGMPMKNYHSKSLNRDFNLVYFVSGLEQAGAAAARPTAANKAVAKQAVDLSTIQAVKGGQTVEQIFVDKQQLADKPIKLRGKVVKFSAEIMGKNWLHIQDGSGSEALGTNDLTVTSAQRAQVGDTVVISGRLTLDKDFGFGYKYAVIIEDAKLVIE